MTTALTSCVYWIDRSQPVSTTQHPSLLGKPGCRWSAPSCTHGGLYLKAQRISTPWAHTPPLLQKVVDIRTVPIEDASENL